MKPYSEHAQASIRMVNNPRLQNSIRKLVEENGIDVVVETGTHDGIGSTKMLAEAYSGTLKPRFFYTCELSFSKYKKARKNLKSYPFVQALWGRSVKLAEAIEFIRNDEALQHHEKYPDVFIDRPEDPAAFYIKECQSGFLSRKKAFLKYLDPRYGFMRLTQYQGEDLLRTLLGRHLGDRPLILLDSAGGIGYLEFKIVKEVMRGHAFWLLLDDIHHLKHFRSFSEIQSDPSFQIIDHDAVNGWVLAKHTPSSPAAS